MENYTRRSKSILSLTVFFVIFNGCCSKSKMSIPSPQIPVVEIKGNLIRYHKKDLIVNIIKDYKQIDSTETIYSEKIYNDDSDSLINKITNQKISKEEHYFVISIKDFIKNYKIKNGHLINIEGQNSIIDILRQENNESIVLAYIKNAEFVSVEKILKTKNGVIDVAEGIVYKQNNIDYFYENLPNVYIKTKDKDTVQYKKYNEYLPLRFFFKEGSGSVKKYHYIWTNLEYIRSYIKEEGEVKNNFKLGEWKYYNKNGVIDSTKTYTLKDSVDIRFPHCIFNKREPCYSENK